ncbi:hypothetical protein AYI68_g2265 [Smittium mucronatum]|uniref:Uncharacterized protein n=1 Tax=Smittium mucronatum TaxID=133383 RepID=A0A1R0H389_9FUNG|nr:hypothetical protein AYI68_g2265 [Smittium mucronatum]
MKNIPGSLFKSSSNEAVATVFPTNILKCRSFFTALSAGCILKKSPGCITKFFSSESFSETKESSKLLLESKDG